MLRKGKAIIVKEEGEEQLLPTNLSLCDIRLKTAALSDVWLAFFCFLIVLTEIDFYDSVSPHAHVANKQRWVVGGVESSGGWRGNR